jgi:ketosteroid isomerase-like protein
VKAAVDGYHSAIASLDLAKIAAAFAHDDAVIDMEPGAKTITLGWEGTRKNFRGLIAATAELSIAQTEGPHIQVQDDLAWSVGTAKADGKLKTGEHRGGVILEAHVFKKQDGRWLLVSHVASVMPQVNGSIASPELLRSSLQAKTWGQCDMAVALFTPRAARSLSQNVGSTLTVGSATTQERLFVGGVACG